MARLSKDQLQERRSVLRFVLAELLGEERKSVGVVDLLARYQAAAGKEIRIGAVGGFANFLKAEGFTTTKRAGEVWVALDADAQKYAFPGGGQSPKPFSNHEHTAAAATGSPLVRVDTPLLLHRVAEGMDMLFDLRGHTEGRVLAELRESLARFDQGVASKVDRLNVLAGAMALNGAEL